MVNANLLEKQEKYEKHEKHETLANLTKFIHVRATSYDKSIQLPEEYYLDPESDLYLRCYIKISLNIYLLSR